MSTELIFDERIRNWVFLPLLYIMFMMGIIKIAIGKLMNDGKPTEIKITEIKKVKENNEK